MPKLECICLEYRAMLCVYVFVIIIIKHPKTHTHIHTPTSYWHIERNVFANNAATYAHESEQIQYAGAFHIRIRSPGQDIIIIIIMQCHLMSFCYAGCKHATSDGVLMAIPVQFRAAQAHAQFNA